MSKKSQKKLVKVLFLVPYPTEGASARLRVEQFLPYLDKAGVRYSVRPFYKSEFYNILYRRGHTLWKITMFAAACVRRLCDMAIAPFYDVIFIHREVFPIGPPILEYFLFFLRAIFRFKVIFDYDDAIYLSPHGSGQFVSILKCPWKADYIIRHADLVIAGNDFLYEHARRFNDNVEIIPTSIDTTIYSRPVDDKAVKSEVVIGWIGSHTTQVFLKELKSVFLSLLDNNKTLRIHIVGGNIDSLKHERLICKEWSLENEICDISHFDIGIMPMPETEWTRGKCAFKAILYMSMGLPVVASPVGVNSKIIDDGVNGCLASSPVEWIEKLSTLVGDMNLRRSMGKAGRSTVVSSFSLEANATKFLKAILIPSLRGEF